MYANVGTVDARLRVALGVIMILVAAVFNQNPVISLAAGLIALILFGTALIRFCPLYRLLHIDTCPHRQ